MPALLFLSAAPTSAAVVNITAGSGTPFLTYQDGSSNNFSAVGIAGLTATNQADVDSSHRLLTLSSQSGTWTVQPGNTANTTAWLVTGTGGTFPITASDGSNVTLGSEADAANAATGHTLMSAVRQVDADIVTLNTTAGNPLATQNPA